MNAYLPINCGNYDELELFAMRGSTITLEYKKKDGHLVSLTTQIKDLTTKNKVEYLITTQDVSIRLDHLVSINGKVLEAACSIL